MVGGVDVDVVILRIRQKILDDAVRQSRRGRRKLDLLDDVHLSGGVDGDALVRAINIGGDYDGPRHTGGGVMDVETSNRNSAGELCGDIEINRPGLNRAGGV